MMAVLKVRGKLSLNLRLKVVLEAGDQITHVTSRGFSKQTRDHQLQFVVALRQIGIDIQTQLAKGNPNNNQTIKAS